jgi:hypothetical protein
VVGDVWKVSFWSTLLEQAAVNVRYWRVIAQPGGEPSPLAIAGFFSATFHAIYKAVLANTAFFHGVHAMKWRPAPPQVGSVNTVNQGPGTAGTEALPKQVSGIITLTTGNATRRGRGRVYVPFPSEAHSNPNGNPLQLYTDQLVNLAVSFRLELSMIGGNTDTTFRPVLFGRARPAIGNRPALPEIITDITGAVARPKFATQRRRGNYGRPNSAPS